MNPTRAARPVPLLDTRAQYASIREEIDTAVFRVIESQHFILGPEVEALESEVAAYSGCRFAVGVSSGTDALLAALMTIAIGPGDEVITTPYTFFATAGSIARLGATPVFVDIDPVTYNIEPSKIDAVVTDRTRAIVPVHLFGQCADMVTIMDIARDRDLYVVEDAAQAIGADQSGRRAGSIGHMGCLSFYPSKNLGAFGDAGMVLTNDPDLRDRLRLFRNHGFSPKYYNSVLGGNFRLDALQAAVLRVKLAHLDGWTRARRENAGLYRELLAEAGVAASDGEFGSQHGSGAGDRSPPIELPRVAEGNHHIYNQFVIRSGRRDPLRAHLSELGIGTEVYYPVPLHLQECFGSLGYRAGSFPQSERAAEQTLALPIYPELARDEIAAVVDAIADYARGVD